MSLYTVNTFIWIGLFALGFVNGTLREVVIKRFLAEPYAHHVSVLTAIIVFTLYGALIWRRTSIGTWRQATWIGVYWFALTTLTETFLLNRWISKMSWEQILETYNLAHGELWPIALLWVGILPPLLFFWKGSAGNPP